MADLIRFPQERVDYDTVRMDWDLPTTILILPVVRIERCEGPPALLGGAGSDRCRAAFAELEAALPAHERFDL